MIIYNLFLGSFLSLCLIHFLVTSLSPISIFAFADDIIALLFCLYFIYSTFFQLRQKPKKNRQTSNNNNTITLKLLRVTLRSQHSNTQPFFGIDYSSLFFSFHFIFIHILFGFLFFALCESNWFEDIEKFQIYMKKPNSEGKWSLSKNAHVSISQKYICIWITSWLIMNINGIDIDWFLPE